MSRHCPHCQALLEPDPASGALPPRCPHCDGTPDAAATDQPPAEDAAAPAQVAPPARWRMRQRELAAAAALAALLLLQVFAMQRDALAADARWRPALQWLCQIAGCRLPPWHEPQAIRLLQRSVLASPQRPDVLQVRFSARNEARWAQPWPRLLLTLSDVDGQPLASGTFAPAQYLGREPDDALLQPGAQVQAVFEVREPPGTAVAFDFQFL